MAYGSVHVSRRVSIPPAALGLSTGSAQKWGCACLRMSIYKPAHASAHMTVARAPHLTRHTRG